MSEFGRVIDAARSVREEEGQLTEAGVEAAPSTRGERVGFYATIYGVPSEDVAAVLAASEAGSGPDE